MSWKDELRPASFSRSTAYGGSETVRFHVLSRDFETGRRVVVSDSPGRDDPFVEDLGRAGRRINLQAYFLGDDYRQRRDQLLRMIADSPGPGFYNDPWTRTFRVQPGRVSVREERDAGGYAVVAVEFTEDPAPVVVATSTPTVVLDDAAEVIVTATRETLATELETTGVPQSAVDAAANEVTKVGSALTSVSAIPGLVSKSAELLRKARNLIHQAHTLVIEPSNLASELASAFDETWDVLTNAATALEVYRRLDDLVPEPLRGTRESKNAGAVIFAARDLSVAGWARELARRPHASWDDAVAARGVIVDRIDALIAGAAGSRFDALRSLRAAVAHAVPDPAADLPRLRRVVLPATMPAVVVAYRYFADRDRSDEIVQRNDVANPLFVPGGVPIEMLAR